MWWQQVRLIQQVSEICRVGFGPSPSARGASELGGWNSVVWVWTCCKCSGLDLLKFGGLCLDPLQVQRIRPAEIRRVGFGPAASEADWTCWNSAGLVWSRCRSFEICCSGSGFFKCRRFPHRSPLTSWSHLVAISTALVCLKEYIIFPSGCTVIMLNTINKIDNSYAYRQCTLYWWSNMHVGREMVW
jgi:hypothetical protein